VKNKKIYIEKIRYSSMNFKLSLWKTVVAFLGGILGGIWASQISYFGGTGPRYVLSTDSFIGFIIPLAVIYLIWSLLEPHRLSRK
jgi:hypothetical protein